MPTSIDFDNQTIRTNHTYRIDVFEDCPDIIAIGDSHISGYPAHRSMADPSGSQALFNPASSISYQLSQLTGWTYQNMGYSGQRSDEIRARFEKDVIEKRPTYALIEGGFNDYKTDRSQEDTIADLSWMINRSLEEGIIPISFAILPTNEVSKGGDESNMTERDYINNYLWNLYRGSIPTVNGRYYVGQYNPSYYEGNLWNISSAYVSADRYHYTTTGYTVLANAVYRSVYATSEIYYIPGANISVGSNGFVSYSDWINETGNSSSMRVTPSAGVINVSFVQWDNSSNGVKKWKESSETHSAMTVHNIAGFAPLRYKTVLIDGNEYTTKKTNGAGVLTFTYSGGYSEHEFEIIDVSDVGSLAASAMETVTSLWGAILGLIAAAVVIVISCVVIGSTRKGYMDSAVLTEVAIGVVVLCVVLVVGAILLSAI